MALTHLYRLFYLTYTLAADTAQRQCLMHRYIMSNPYEEKLRAVYAQRSVKLSYSLRKILGAKSLQSYKSYEDYVEAQIKTIEKRVLAATAKEKAKKAPTPPPPPPPPPSSPKPSTRSTEKVAPEKKPAPPVTPAPGAPVDPLAAILTDGRTDIFLDTVDLWLRSGIDVSPTQFVTYARICVEEGQIERLLEKRDVISDRVWLAKGFRFYYFIALLMAGEFAEARFIALESIRGGAVDKRLLLRIIGESYLLSDPIVLKAAAEQIIRYFGKELTPAELVYVYNVVSLQLGDEELLRIVQPGSLTRKDRNNLLFASNVALREQDFARQLRTFNAALELNGLSPVSALDSSKPLHVTNITSMDSPGIVRGPLVTVLMSTFNSAVTLRNALGSLRGQTYADLEILVIDDGSSDHSVKIARECAKEDRRISVHQMPENGGTYRIRNFGLSKAKGTYFTCLDSDDWAHPTRIETLVTILEKDPNLIAARSQLVRLSGVNGVKPRPAGYVHDDMSSLTFRREEVVNKMGYYQQVTTGADSEFIKRLETVFGVTAIQLVAKPLLVADWSATSLSGSPLTGITEGGTMSVERVKFRATFRKAHSEGEHLYVAPPMLDAQNETAAA